MKRLKREPGTFFRIPLADGSFGYGRMLESPYTAYYRYQTTEPSCDLDVIASKPVLFRQAVRTQIKNNWVAIGHAQLSGEVAEPVVRFMQSIGNFRDCTIFDSAGSAKPATPEECIGLERAAVWDPHHIEERLLDIFNGRTNATELRLRVHLE